MNRICNPYEQPLHSGMLPLNLLHLVHSKCMLERSVKSSARWSLELQGIIFNPDNLEAHLSPEEINQELADVTALNAQRSAVLTKVTYVLTAGALPRRG